MKKYETPEIVVINTSGNEIFTSKEDTGLFPVDGSNW